MEEMMSLCECLNVQPQHVVASWTTFYTIVKEAHPVSVVYVNLKGREIEIHLVDWMCNDAVSIIHVV